MASKNPQREKCTEYLRDKLCTDAILRERLKSQLGVDGERKGVEFCTIYDDEWPDLIKHILLRYEDLSKTNS